MGISIGSEAATALRSLWHWLIQPAQHGWLGLIGSFLVVAAPAAAYTLNHFYVYGAATDSLALAWMVWRNSSLDMPASLAAPLDHFTPILFAPALLSYFLPIGMFMWYALFIGAAHGLVGAAVFNALRGGIHAVGRLWMPVALVIALGYGLCGFALAAMLLPHYEILFVGFGILFLASLARGARKASWIWFVLTLSVREDAGFHMFGVLLLAQVWCRKRDAWPFLFAALMYGVLAVGFKHIWGPSALLPSMFIGNPPYAHWTWGLVQERLSTIFWWRGYVWQTAVVTILWALWARDKLILAGLVAALPWTVLCVSGVGGAPATLDLYYPFPLFLAMAWPIIAVRWRHGEAVTPRLRRQTLVWASVMALSAALGWRDGPICYPCSKTIRFGHDRVSTAQVDEFGIRLRETVPQLGNTRVDMAVMALWPDAGARLGWLYPEALIPGSLRGNDSVIWYESSLYDSLAWAAWLTSGLQYHYRVMGTNIVVASNRPLGQLTTLAPQLLPTNVVWDRMRPTPIARREKQGFVVRRGAPAGLIAEGPHSWMDYGINSHHSPSLPAGRYEARFAVRFTQIGDSAAPLLRLEAGFAGSRIAAREIRASELSAAQAAGQQAFIAALPFEVTPAQRASFLQLRPIHLGNADLELSGISLVRTDIPAFLRKQAD